MTPILITVIICIITVWIASAKGYSSEIEYWQRETKRAEMILRHYRQGCIDKDIQIAALKAGLNKIETELKKKEKMYATYK